MLETANWIQKYFNQSPDAIFLFKNDDLLVSNEPAQRLVTMLNLDVNYLLQIGKNAWSQLENDDCASCLIKKRLTGATVPITFHSNAGIHFLVWIEIPYQIFLYKKEDICCPLVIQSIHHKNHERRLNKCPIMILS